MAAGCCSVGGCQDDVAPPDSVIVGHDHGHETHDHDNVGCSDQGDCCDDEACCDGTESLSSRSAPLACCNSNEEHCDEKCIMSAAALECEQICKGDTAAQHGATSHEHAHDKDGFHTASACSTHLAKAFDQYSAYLETARCICRNISDRGWAMTCCDKMNTGTTVDKAATVAYVTRYGLHKQKASHHHHGMKRRDKETSISHDDLAIKHATAAYFPNGHDVEHFSFSEKPPVTVLAHKDLEKAEGLKHVILTVDGMTCSGCGNKMERTLRAIPGVSAVRVNFVVGHAEFSVDSTANTPEKVVREAQRATGFHCTRLASDDQTIDLVASGAAAKALTNLAIDGMTNAVILNKKTVRLTYDPAVIGARTLVEVVRPLSEGLAPPRDDPSVSRGRKRLYDQLIKTAVAAALTIPVVVLAWGDTIVDEKTRAYVSIILATFVQLIAVPDFYRPAISALVYSGSIEMDMLVVISITAAYTYSVVAFGFRMADRPLDTSEFFQTSTLLITLVILGRLVATFARVRAVAAVSLRSLQASTAIVVENGKDSEIDARLLQYGDKFKIGPHSAVPTDGLVVSGSGEVDESMLTGESMPVFKEHGNNVIAGTVNGSGTLVARLTRLPGKNTVTDIAQLVEEAANSKPKLQDIADRVARWFVPIVTSVAVIILVVWLVVGLKVRNYSTGKAISNAITYTVATLAISCPCALGLAVPMVLVVAGGIAARGGVIIKSAECTERARKVTDVVFDKTGTITEGDLDVIEEEFFVPDKDEAMAITKALVAGNKHPVSLAVAKHLEQRATPEINPTAIHVIPGAGVKALLDEVELRAGHAKWTATETDPSVTRLQDGGLTVLVVTRNTIPIAVYGLSTRLRKESVKVVAQLIRRNIAVHLVSGDQKHAVESVAAQVGIPNVASQCTPAQKRDYVASLMSQSKNVMFVGDGTNDAVAVAQADVGVQLASVFSASDVTRGAADVVLFAGLEGIPFLLDISSLSFRRMVFNFGWSAVYNVLAILLASGAFVSVRIPPAYAGLGEIVSVLPVIFAACTMLLKRNKTDA